MKKVSYTKTALTFSVILLVICSVLGIGTTLAWFTDTTPVDRNAFQVGILDLSVSYTNDVVTQYTPVERNTAVFNDEALYEPGYTQVVNLKIENTGDVAFDYKVAVNVSDYTDSVSVLGNDLHLPDYLRFGVIFGATEAELDRALARENALEDMESYCLDTYSQMDTVSLAPGEVRYAALVVYMPEEIDNAANYRGLKVPAVELGLTVYAQQAGTPMA